jgi:NAD(P)-dependent dehydrogenase (short-subunit alcohol dehydrogenase family)
MEKVSKRVILVTGGGQGLGAAIVRTLASENTVVVPLDVKIEQAEKLCLELRSSGYDAKAYKLDVTDVSTIESVVQQIAEEYGHIDVLVNNAGTDFTKPIEELSVKEIDIVLNVNLRGPFLMAKTVWPIMTKQGNGHVVNICSTASKRVWPNATAYFASKQGLLGLSHALLVEGRDKGIKCTAVIAGGMKTPFILDRFPEAEPNLQNPVNVAETIKYVLSISDESVIPEVMVLPMRETSWP